MRRRLCAQAGQTAAEYMGLLLVISVIIAAVATTTVGTQIREEMSRIVCEIFGGDCGEPDEPPKLSACVTAEATEKITIDGDFNVRLVNVKLEGGVEYTRQKRADGKVAMTFKLATSGGVGEKIKKYLDVAVKGGPASSVTFVLPNDEAANRFGQQIKDSAKAIALSPLNRFGIGGEPHIDFPPIESVSYEQTGGVSVGADLESSGGYGNGSLEFGGALGVKRNLINGETTAYYKINGKGQGAAGMPLIGPGLHRRAERRTDALGDLGQGSQRDEAESPGRGRVRGRCGRPSQRQGPAGRAEVHRRNSTSRPTRAAARSWSSRSTSR